MNTIFDRLANQTPDSIMGGPMTIYDPAELRRAFVAGRNLALQCEHILARIDLEAQAREERGEEPVFILAGMRDLLRSALQNAA